MVDVEGLKRFKRRLIEKCNNCSEEQVANTEWNIRESLSHIIKTEIDQFTIIFSRFPDLKFYPTALGSLNEIIYRRETLGVTTNFMGYNLFECPILLGGKMFALINSGYQFVDSDIWLKSQYAYPSCLFCNFDSESYIPTTFIVRGKIYTLGYLAWTNYERTLYLKKQESFVMFRKSPNLPITDVEFPVLNDFALIQHLLRTAIGNRKLFNAGFIFTEMISQTLFDITRFCKSPKKNLLIKQLIKNQNQRINLGAIDSIVGKNTDFNVQEQNDQQTYTATKTYNPNNVGRYKLISKMDFTIISKALQLDQLTTKYSKKIPIDLQKADVGFVCLVSSSEQSAGTLGQESVLGCVTSSPSDCIPENKLINILQSFENTSVTLLSDFNEYKEADSSWYLILNQSVYKHNSIPDTSLYKWVIRLRQYFKSIGPFVEVYSISERLYCIHSLGLVIFKIFHDGLPYSSMEVATTNELFIDLVANNYNLHGPTCLLIKNLNCNYLVRNTIAVHAIKHCVSGNCSSLLKNETYILNKFQPVKGVPFYCVKSNILIFPLPYNIEDSCVLTQKAVDKGLFTVRNKCTSTVHIENPTFIKNLIKNVPTLIRPNLVLMKIQAEKVIHTGKNLTLMPDLFQNDIQNVVFTPNMDVVVKEEVTLDQIKITHDEKKNSYYCDFVLFYDQSPVLGTKIVIKEGVQKCVFGYIMPNEETPILHSSMALDDVVKLDIDLIQHPFSLKRLSMNFLYDSPSEFYNDCFSISPLDRLRELEKKKDYFISDPKTKRFYVDKNGLPIKVLVYTGSVLIMGKQNPYNLMHTPDISSTAVSALTNQPEIRYQTSFYVNQNNHSYAVSDSERDLAVSIGCLNAIEEFQDLSDECHMVLENVSGSKVCVPSSGSLKRVLDFMSLAGINIDFSIKDVETEF